MNSDKYFIKKNGGYYRPGSKGYTDKIYEAGVYTEDEAKKEEAEVKGCKAVRCSDRHLMVPVLHTIKFDMMRKLEQIENTVELISGVGRKRRIACDILRGIVDKGEVRIPGMTDLLQDLRKLDSLHTKRRPDKDGVLPLTESEPAELNSILKYGFRVTQVRLIRGRGGWLIRAYGKEWYNCAALDEVKAILRLSERFDLGGKL